MSGVVFRLILGVTSKVVSAQRMERLAYLPTPTSSRYICIRLMPWLDCDLAEYLVIRDMCYKFLRDALFLSQPSFQNALVKTMHFLNKAIAVFLPSARLSSAHSMV